MIRIETIKETNAKRFIILCKDKEYNENVKYSGIGITKNNQLNWIYKEKNPIRNIRNFREILNYITNHR
jgi:hypothetical protein